MLTKGNNFKIKRYTPFLNQNLTKPQLMMLTSKKIFKTLTKRFTRWSRKKSQVIGKGIKNI